MACQPSSFISHKHADRKIAAELRKFLNQWSRKEIPVFQSSDPLAQGPRLATHSARRCSRGGQLQLVQRAAGCERPPMMLRIPSQGAAFSG